MDARLNFFERLPDVPRVAAPEPTVPLRGFTRTFGETTVLQGLDLDIQPGEFVAQERITIARGERGDLTQPLRHKLLGILGGNSDPSGQNSGVIPFPQSVHA